MKILEISDSQTHGGAAIASNRIHNCLSNTDLSIKRLTSNSDENHSIFTGRKFHFFQNILSFFNQDKTILNLYKKEILKQFKIALLREKPDALHFHNIHSANWPIDIIKAGLDYCNVVWTLHDCWSFITSYYEGYKAPFFEEDDARKNRFWESLPQKQFNLVGVTPSAWMKKTAQDSLWSKNKIEIIHNPVPHKFFKTTQRNSTKKALGLDEQLPVVLCCAANLNEERKGARFLDAILNHKILEKFQLVLLGNCNLSADSQNGNVHNLGFIRDDITLRMVYSAADMLKMDIEGSEKTVIPHCNDLLRNVKNLFIEYHGSYKDHDSLLNILNILRKTGFIFRLRELSVEKKPFYMLQEGLEKKVQYNIFAYQIRELNNNPSSTAL